MSSSESPSTTATTSERESSEASSYRFRLFVVGQSELNQRAEANFETVVLPALRRRGLDDSQIELQVVDLADDPAAARKFNVIATPLLVRLAPDPTVRVLGTMDEVDRTLASLDLA